MTATASIAFHAVSPDGAEAVVVLLERGAGADRFRVTEWESAGFAAPGRISEVSREEVELRVEAWRRDGWRFSESPLRIRAWLVEAGH